MPQQQPPPSAVAPKPSHMQRYLPLMGSQEPSHLSSSDTLACRSYELFEVTDLFGQQQQGVDDPIVAGQVGLRCAFCAESSETTSSYVFPADTRSVGDSLRHSCFEHLAQHCGHFPEEYKRQIQEALRRRKQLKQEGGASAAHEEEGNRRALVDFCAKRCLQAGIVDRHPTGMVFADTQQPLVPTTMATQPPMMQPPRPYAVQPPYPGMQQHAPAQMTAKRGGDDASSLEPVPVAAARNPPQQQQQQQPIQPHYHAMQPQQQHHHYTPMQQTEFPFFYEQNRWVCKFCAHLPPPYRDPQYFWANNSNNPPPGNFVDYHLSICREFQKAMMYEQQYAAYRGADPRSAGRGGGVRSSPSFGGWDTQQQQHMAMAPATPRTAGSIEFPSSPGDQAASPYNTPSYVSGGGGPPSESQQRQTLMATPITQPHASSQHRPPETPEEVVRAIEYLEKHDKSRFDNDGRPVLEADRLVLEEDRLLLTEYFYYLMKQLRLVRFSEADRRTRGGKREKIQVGYGGLQCVHCVDIPNTRKFFWSNVDRLANSFAEIPSHVLKCRRCPQPTKDALLQLKQCHAEQMTRLPRGSQKVFFRRMWRRLHDADPQDNVPGSVDPSTGYPTPSSMMPTPHSGGYQGHAGGGGGPPMRPSPLDTRAFHPSSVAAAPTAQSTSDISPTATSGSDESIYFLQRPSKEGAKALAVASIQPGPPSPNSRVLLAIPEDKEWLSDIDCFIRRQLEVFCATEEDVQAASEDRKYPVKEGQVGIRCIHCAMAKNGDGAKGQAVAYPFSISGIYESAREFQRLHLETCENLPLSAKSKLESLKGSSSLSSVLRKYFILAAQALGLQDSIHGIRAGAEAVAIGSQAAFAFSDSSGGADEMKPRGGGGGMSQSPVPDSSRRKRKAEYTSAAPSTSHQHSGLPSGPGEEEDQERPPDRKRPALASAAAAAPSSSYYASSSAPGRAESKERESTRGGAAAPASSYPSSIAASAPSMRQEERKSRSDEEEEEKKPAEASETADV